MKAKDTAVLAIWVFTTLAAGSAVDAENYSYLVSRHIVDTPAVWQILGEAGSIASKLLIKISSLPQAVAKRRENYLAWHRNVQDLPHCQPLFAALPDGCVPYMFPLVIDFPQDHFYALKTMGMPIWRWDDMAWSSCSTAQKYRQHLLHLPCHQSLSEVEMRWMMSAVALVMTRVPQRRNS